jgi:hypothetical protein
MPSSFGKKKSSVQQNGQPRRLDWSLGVKPFDPHSPVAIEMRDALHRIMLPVPRITTAVTPDPR